MCLLAAGKGIKEMTVLVRHNKWVNPAAFSPDGQWVVTASDDGASRVHALHIRGLSRNNFVLSPLFSRCKLGGYWRTSPKDLMELTQQQVAREFTCQEREQFLQEGLLCEEQERELHDENGQTEPPMDGHGQS